MNMPWVVPSKTVLQMTQEQDQRLFQLVRVKVLRPFCIRGIRQEVDAVVSLDRCTAEGLASIQKVALLDEREAEKATAMTESKR